jgi:hypothetical protein
MFVIIDSGTHLILGHAVGDVGNSLAGYRAAASDAVARILHLSKGRAIWADHLERSQLVPGDDREAISNLATGLRTTVGVSAPQLLTSWRPYGRYIRRHLGLKLGPIRIIPSRTGRSVSAAEVADGGIVTMDAHARLELEVIAHNAAITADLAIDGAEAPPADLVRLLAEMAGA